MIGPVLLIGSTEREECRAIAEQLQTVARLMVAPDATTACAMLASAQHIDLVLLAPAFRNQFPDHTLQQLVRQQPLAEWWLIAGPWLEGETRSGRPWPGGRRFYLDQALAELRRRIDRASVDGAPATEWLPATFSAEERWLVDRPSWPEANGCVRVCSELPETRRTLASICTAMGLTTMAHGPEEVVDARGVDAAIYDAVASGERWWTHIERLTISRPRSLVVLVNFPRPDEIRRLRAAGATDVLGKPFRIDDLRSSVLRGWA